MFDRNKVPNLRISYNDREQIIVLYTKFIQDVEFTHTCCCKKKKLDSYAQHHVYIRRDCIFSSITVVIL